MQHRTLTTTLSVLACALLSISQGCERHTGPREAAPHPSLLHPITPVRDGKPEQTPSRAPQHSKAPTTAGANPATTKTTGANPATTKTTGANPATTRAAGENPATTRAAPANPAIAFRDLVAQLSEPDAPFFSDNYISNETSYLQVAAELERRAAGGGSGTDGAASFAPARGVYIGVGPEQNFTYIALSRPQLAFIVDIRRQNMILHLLYKALFDEASTRSHFLTLLLGRPYEQATDPGPTADIGSILAHAARLAPDETTFVAIHERARKRIEEQYGIKLDAQDRKSLEVSHRAFLQDQLGLRFSLREPNGRVYPTLRELFETKSPDGRPLGFLAREADFRFVQALEREHRIIPVVGDFAGDRAMPGIAAYLARNNLTVSTFYVSNVEQYLFEGNVWPQWSRNVAALPADGHSVFIRAYLDQGRAHPKQMKGHRTATVLQTIAHFNAQQKKRPYVSFWAVVTDAAGEPL